MELETSRSKLKRQEIVNRGVVYICICNDQMLKTVTIFKRYLKLYQDRFFISNSIFIFLICNKNVDIKFSAHDMFLE